MENSTLDPMPLECHQTNSTDGHLAQTMTTAGCKQHSLTIAERALERPTLKMAGELQDGDALAVIIQLQSLSRLVILSLSLNPLQDSNGLRLISTLKLIIPRLLRLLKQTVESLPILKNTLLVENSTLDPMPLECHQTNSTDGHLAQTMTTAGCKLHSLTIAERALARPTLRTAGELQDGVALEATTQLLSLSKLELVRKSASLTTRPSVVTNMDLTVALTIKVQNLPSVLMVIKL